MWVTIFLRNMLQSSSGLKFVDDSYIRSPCFLDVKPVWAQNQIVTFSKTSAFPLLATYSKERMGSTRRSAQIVLHVREGIKSFTVLVSCKRPSSVPLWARHRDVSHSAADAGSVAFSVSCCSVGSARGSHFGISAVVTGNLLSGMLLSETLLLLCTTTPTAAAVMKRIDLASPGILIGNGYQRTTDILWLLAVGPV